MFMRTFSHHCIAAMLLLLAGLPASAQFHSADTLPDQQISLSELLRVIQFFNSGGFHCMAGTEDGYTPGPDPAQQSCAAHDSDYSPQDWLISLSELLRVIQFFNSSGYHTECGTEDNFAPGPGGLFNCGAEGEGAAEGEGTVEGEGTAEGEGAVEGEGEATLPTADFIAQPLSGLAPLIVNFEDTSFPGLGTITKWAWEFGDGASSAEQHPSHEYATPGHYTVSLTVTTEMGGDTETKFEYLWVTGIQLWNAVDLQRIGNEPGYPLDGHYTMMQNIVVNAKGLFTPIGSLATPFTGIFDGNDFSIIGLHIDLITTDYVGLFAVLGTGATVTDLGIEESSVAGHNYVGGLAGMNNGAFLQQCSVSGYVSGALGVGGLLGSDTGGMVSGCHTSGTVYALHTGGGGLIGFCDATSVGASTSSANVTVGPTPIKVTIGDAGGLVGRATGAFFAHCGAFGDVWSDYFVGGFAGTFASCTSALGCYAEGIVSGNNYVGGFVGQISQTTPCLSLSKCYATGNVQLPIIKGGKVTSGMTGGLAGYTQYAIIEDCHAQGAVSGTYYAAGLSGHVSNSTFTRCYSVGHVSGTANLGGLVAASVTSSESNCFWDTETSNQAASALGTGKTTEEMKTQATYINWDYETIWSINENASYPWLQGVGPEK